MRYAFVLWNRDIYPQMYDYIDKIKSGESVEETWPFQENAISEGDRVFVYSSDKTAQGFIAAGHAITGKYTEKNEEGKNEGVIKIKFDSITEFNNGECLSLDTINEISPRLAQRSGSGHMIPDDKRYDIELAWAKTIGVKNDAYNLLKVSPDIIPDEHDGSYKLVREAVDSFSKIQDRSIIDNKDLDLIYRFSVITANKDTHINAINNTHLPQGEKNRLINIVNDVWEKVANHQYSNSNNQVGMFRDALHTYKKRVNDPSIGKKIIDALIYIKDNDDIQSYQYIKDNFNLNLKGIGYGSFSELAHCLKPYSFPILNGNQGKGNIYKEIGVDLIESNILKDYAINCERINAFRDENFTFKNHRVFDLILRIDELNNIDVQENKYGIFIVFQRGGKNGQFANESTAGILEAPKKDKSGKTPHHWKRIENVKKDDLIFHMSGQKIAAVSIAKDKVHDNETGTGYILESEYTILANKLDLVPLRQTIVGECRGFKASPFNKNGTGNEGYLFDMPPGLSDKFIDEIIESNPNQDLDFLNKYKSRVKDSNTNDNLVGVNKMANLKKNTSLNTILYGPPGTGKTYNSKVYAVAICECNGDIEELIKKYPTYDKILEAYDVLEKEKRIAFTTFHQSYGYEEFIEGIKPKIKDDGSNDVYYDIVPGIFKKFCDDNRPGIKDLETYGIDSNTPIWKFSVDGGKTNIIKECFKNKQIRINFDLNSNDYSMMNFRDRMQAGDIILSFYSTYEINGVGIVKNNEIRQLNTKTFKLARDVDWLFKDIVVNIKDINNGFGLSQKTCTSLPNLNKSALFTKINEILNGNKNEKKNCVFIIDEINRGNVSKIFGELITLIETSKRDGAAEKMQCLLPYSNTPFSVPDNVYILGTMNTADRSIALMDTALRRRFDFIEMMPDYEVDFMQNLKVGNIDIVKMLRAMNDRIEVLYDREHTLGHAFFKGVSTIEELGIVFENKIIPLLQEYFFEDYEKIALVLGDNAKTDKNFKFIITDNINANIFRNGDIPDSIVDKRVSKLNLKEAIEHEESYIQIYE